MGTMQTPLERLPTVSAGSLRQLMTTRGWFMKTTRKELLGNMRAVFSTSSSVLQCKFFFLHIDKHVITFFKAQNLTAIFRCSKNRLSLVLGRRSDRKASVGN